MFKVISLVVLSVLLIISSGAQALAFSSTGSGTVGDPYQIRTCSELQEMRDDLDAYYILENDIDCTSVTNWEPVGFYSGARFVGSLDGQGYGVYNLNYTGDGPAGVFGYISGGVVRNLGIYSSSFVAAGTVGALAGDAENSTIVRITVSNTTVASRYATGGIIGIADTVALSSSATNDTTVSGGAGSSSKDNIGGIIGMSNNSSLTNVSSGGVVTFGAPTAAVTSIGGVIGYSQGDSISNSYNDADITGKANTGGIIGNATSSGINKSYSSGDVTGTSNVGGLIGYQGLSSATSSFSSSLVSGTSNVGGVMGHVVAIGGGLTNTTWDITRSSQTDCVGLDESITIPTDCTGVNAASAQPNYFFNNTTNSPLNSWDYIDDWYITDSLPLLITTADRVDNVRVVRTTTTLNVSWEVPATTGGTAITSYDLKYRPSSSATSTVITGLAPDSPSSYLIQNLTPNTEYTIEIRANNAKGAGIWSGFITTTTQVTAVISSLTETPATESEPVQIVSLEETPTIASNALNSPMTSTSEEETSVPTDTTDPAQVINPFVIVIIIIGALGVGFAVFKLLARI